MKKKEIRILLIEDNVGDVDLLRETLAEEVSPIFEIENTPTVQAGLDRLQKGGIDIILLDLALPDSIGFDTFSKVHSQAGEVPIVVLTIMDDAEMGITAVRMGAQDYLFKGQDRGILSRVIRYAIERKQVEESQRFLARAGVELAESLGSSETNRKIARLAVPRLADCCMVHFLTNDRTLTEEVAVAHIDAEMESQIQGQITTSRVEPELQHGLTRVLNTAKAEIYSNLSATEGALTELESEFFRRLRSLNAHSYICVPLVARGQVFGAITLIRSKSTCPYTTSDLVLAEELALRASLAIDNSRLFITAQEALRSREDLLEFVSHDLKTPLTSIQMNAHLIQRIELDERQTATSRIKYKANSIHKASVRMNHLITSLMDLSKIESGRLIIDKEEFPINALMSEAIEMILPIAETKRIKLEAEDIDKTYVILGDRERLMQVFANLLGNAIKFTPEDGQIQIRVAYDSKGIQFTIADTGPGIPEEQLLHVFSRYWQGKQKSKSGSGLGLFISKGIIESHGGRMWAKSRVGVGTELHFTLPEGKSVAPSEKGRKSVA